MSLPFVQTALGRYATNQVNKEFDTDISIDKVTLTAFGSVKLKGILVRDHHKDTLFFIKRLNTSLLSVKELYNNGHPYLGDAILDGLTFNLKQYKGENFTNIDKFIESFDDGKPSTGKFRMKATELTLVNSKLTYVNENLQQPKILNFTELNGNIKDFFIKGADVTTFIETLSFKDHRGLFVKNLTAAFTYTKKNILLEQLILLTEESSLKGKVELRYKRTDFADFNNKVIFDVQMDEAMIASNDLNYFYNEFGKDNVFDIDTHLIGTLNNFTTQNLHLRDSNDSNISGTVQFKNLFNREESFYIKGEFKKINSNYYNLTAILPNILGNSLPSSLVKLGNVNLVGDVELTSDYINSDVTINSVLGTIITNLSIQDLSNIDNATYQGNVTLNDFNLGTFINESEIGKVTLNLDVEGQGFNEKYLNTNVKGKVSQFYYNHYNYTNITVDGKMKMPYFKGYFNSNDPNLRMDFDGLVDLSSKVKNYNFKANVDYADLHALQFSKIDSTSIFKGKVEFLAKGNTLDDLEGELQVENVSYQNDRDNYYFEDFQLNSSFDKDRVRTITINSNDIISGKVVGKFKINEVRKIVENAVGSLYANYSPNKLQKGQFLDFNFTIYNKIVDIFVPEVSISENTKIRGKINADLGKFEFDFSSPSVLAFGNYFKKIKIDIDNKNPLYNTYIEMDSIRTKNYKISDFNLINLTMNDTLFVRSEFKGGTKLEDNFSLNIYHTIDENKQSVIGFKKSEVNFKDYLWFINEEENNDNKIIFDKKFKDFKFQKIRLSHNNQNMDFYGEMKDSTYKDFNLTFNDVDLDKVTPSLDSISLDGKLNGFVKFQQDKNYYKPLSNVHIDSLKINTYPVGDLYLLVEGNDAFNEFDIDSYIVQKGTERFNLNGTLKYRDNQSTLDMEAIFSRFDLAPFGSLIGNVITDVRGDATGSATIRGLVTDPEVDGRLYLNDAGLKAPYLNVDYDFEKNAIVDITENEFLFRNIVITDTQFDTKGILRGSVKHDKFSDWELDLEVRTNNLLALNTKDSEDAYYYGTAFLNGSARISGRIESLLVTVTGESEKGTSIKIPVRDAEDVGKKPYYTFIKEEDLRSNKKNILGNNKYNGLELSLDFDIDTDAWIEVILDRESGHSMKGNGYGSMRMEINTLGKFLMYGDFQVQEGEYNFKKAGLIDKKFVVKKGSTIRWEGDPLGAILNLEAIYKTQANPSVLIESSSFNTNRKLPTEVSIVINGSLSNPEPDFNINFPTVSSVFKSEIDYRLQNKDVRQNQAFALLAFGSFTTPENAGSVAYGSLFEKASSLFNDIISDEDSKLQVGVNYDQADRINQISGRVGLTLSTQINDKISINGKVGVPVGGVTESVLVGDVEVQLQLNEDGSLRARVFNRENDINYNIGEGIGYTQGLGLSYSLDFDTFGEMFRKIFTKNKDKNATSSSNDDIPDSEELWDKYYYIRKNKEIEDEKEKEKNKELENVPEIE
ncbi:translocation/assembly module TamB domain-containing protein [Flavobacterium sp.]|uniref:translocation/assembly module TamB domain-containing protein n=1 Tax=Flavobacterium sp. TaxID=239 RepID=UPI0025C7214C|nr:translocation/assembly module TamB domain-containing protein [Flavobacterium sp.]